jgi:membrane protein
MTQSAQPAPEELGRDAPTPWRFGWSAWKRILQRTWNQCWIDNVGLVAAGVAFYGFIALIPLLAILVLILGFFLEPPAVAATMEALTAVLPSEVAVLIGEQLVTAMQISEGTKGLAILAALLVALYGGTNAASAIIMALNIAYQEREKRSLARFYLLAAGMTLGALFLSLAALAVTTVIASLERLLPFASGAALFLGKALSGLVLVLAGSGIAATLYRVGPSREQARWTWITPGSLFTSLAWLLLTWGFGFYITRVTDYAATYGPLGAIVALLTWMYLSAYVFVIGAELNSEVEHQTAQDSTTGPPQPIGRRGAWAADHVAGADDTGATAKELKDQPSMAEATPGTPDAVTAKD